jgi:Uma2 family endonuclease
MSSQPLTVLTPEQYLAAERKATGRSEYLNGEVFAMAGASEQHSIIKINLTWSLNDQLRNGPCQVHDSDLRLRVAPAGDYLCTYPDLSVVCGEPRFEDAHFDTLLNPKMIVEILSPSTELFDRRTKAALYRKLDSLTEYLLIAQDRVHVEHYSRQPTGDWLLSERDSLNDAVELASVGAKLKLADIYHRAVFP